MDSIMESLSSVYFGNELIVKEQDKHPRLGLYKNKGRILDQERRWHEQINQIQNKTFREEFFTKNRNEFDEITDESDTINPWASKLTNTQGWRSQRNGLMLAEWFLFKPPSFEEDYFFKLYPIGRHVTVVASKGITRLFARSGHLIFKGDSHLPGGHRALAGTYSRHNNSHSVVLDCVLLDPTSLPAAPAPSKTVKRRANRRKNKRLNKQMDQSVELSIDANSLDVAISTDQVCSPESGSDSVIELVSGNGFDHCSFDGQEIENTMAIEKSNELHLRVLDLVYFRNSSYRDEPFSVRRSWLEDYFKADIERESSEYDEYESKFKFSVIPSFDCSPQVMQTVFGESPPEKLDGVIFYHGDVPYREGATPLVGWLKPYMLAEWFPDLTVHADYMANAPSDYRGYSDDIERFVETERTRQIGLAAQHDSTVSVEQTAAPSLPSP